VKTFELLGKFHSGVGTRTGCDAVVFRLDLPVAAALPAKVRMILGSRSTGDPRRGRRTEPKDSAGLLMRWVVMQCLVQQLVRGRAIAAFGNLASQRE